MKHFLRFICIWLAIFANADALTRGGTQISTTAPLMGIAIAGLNSEYSAGQWIVPCPATTGIDPECAYYHSKNLNVWRLVTNWESFTSTLGGSFNSTYVGYIKNIIRQANLVGAGVIIDLHNFGNYNGNAIGSANGPTISQYAAFWGTMATTFGGEPGLLGYEEMNEPANMPNADIVPDMYQAATTAIRAVDTTSTLYLDGDAYASAYGWNGNCSNCGGAPTGGWNVGGNDDLLDVDDPNNNLVFVAHFYDDFNGSGTYPTYPNSAAVGCTNGQTTYQCAQTMGDQLTSPTSTLNTSIGTKRLNPFITWCNGANSKGKKVSCAVTENGVPYDDANWLTAEDLSTAYMLQNGITFTYWGAGPEFSCTASSIPTLQGCSYNLGVYPTNLSTSVIDTTQMAPLTKYSNAYLPTTYQLYGPNRGSSGVASSAFTVAYRGYIPKSFTITPTDGGAGGTFTPSSLSVSTGFNFTGTFTYTAPGSSVYKISTTNNLNLTDPAALGYSTASDQFSSAGLTTSQIDNILAFRTLYSPYIGPLVNLRRSSDNTTRDFYATALGVNQPLNTAAIIAWNGSTETDVVFSVSFSIQHPLTFASDGGVVYTSSGTALTRVTSSPAVGQYTVTSNGRYGFNAGDIGNSVKISYIFPTYVVKWYDQSPAGGNAGIISPDGSGPTVALSNQPQFLLKCQNNLPCIYFNGTNYMDMYSPLSSGFTQTSQSVLAVFAPGPYENIYNGALIEWAWSGTNLQNFWCNTTESCGGGWGNSYANQVNTDSNPTRTYSTDTIWNATAATYASGVSDGDRTFFNGQITDRSPASSQTYSLPYNRTNATIGYSRFFQPTATYQGYLGEIVVTNNQIANSSVTSFQNDEDTAWGIPTFTGWTPYSPTLNQSTINANTPPWMGTNPITLPYGNLPNAGAPAYYATRGMNIVRVAYTWEQIQKSIGATLDPTALAQMQADVNMWTAAGFDVLLDNHNYAQYNGIGLGNSGAPTIAQFANFYSQMATVFASNPKVKFDLMNEPVNVTNMTTWTAYVQAAINAIRTAGFTNPIFVEWDNGSAACYNGQGAAGTAYLSLTDTSNNLVYECHSYFDSNGGGYLPTAAYANQGAALSNLQPITTWAVANNVRLFYGEFGVGWTPSMYAEYKVAFDLIAANLSNGTSGGWLGWTAWGAGDWGNGYYYYMEPQIIDSNTVDKPVMRILNSYATGHSWPTASGVWPYNVQFP